MVNLEVPHFSTAAPLGATPCTFQPPFTIRRVGLCGSELARAQVTTIRLKVLKIGTVILRNCPRRGPAVSAPRFGVALPREAVAPHPAAVLERLPKSGTLRLDAAQAQFSVKRGRCSPRHPKNNGGKGHCLPSALKPPRESSNRTRPPDFCANTLAAEER